MDQIQIPIKIVSKFSQRSKLLFWSCFLFSLLFGIGMLLILKNYNNIIMWICFLFFTMLACVTLYIIIAVDFLRKYSIELTEQGMSIRIPFRKKSIKWKEIYSATAFSYNNNDMIGLLLKKDLAFNKRSVYRNINALLGGDFSFQFSVGFFNDIDPNMLLRTIENQIDDSGCYEIFYEEREQSFLKGYSSALLATILMSVLYAFSIVGLGRNVVAIPIFGAFLIVAVFNKFYIEEQGGNILIRFLMGLLCFLQVPVALIIAIVIDNNIEFSVENLILVSKEYLEYIFHNFTDNIVISIIAVICFVIGLIIRLEKNDSLNEEI